MIDERILRLTPKRIFCPLCGEWHDWDGKTLQSYDEDDCYEYECNDQDVCIWVDENQICISTRSPCDKINDDIYIEADLCDIEYDVTDPIIKIPFRLRAEEIICCSECEDCEYCDCCNFVTIGENRNVDENEYDFDVEFKFEFASRYFNKYSEAARGEMIRQQREAEEAKRKEELARQREAEATQRQQEIARQSVVKPESKTIANQVEEEKLMAEGTKMSLKKRLYECSPKENFEVVKQWAEKYKPVLKWAIPVVAIYGAYRILNSDEFDLSVNNIAETCERRLGFNIDFLENKKALKELMALGGISAGAYGAMKAVSTIFNSKNEEEISMEDVENGMEKLDTISQKFAWLQPKTEAMLPIALSVIMVYVTLHKPKFTGKFANKVRDLTEDIQVKISTYLDLAKLFIADKLNIDLSDEKEQQKLKICIFLCTLVGISIFLYGKKVLGSKQATEATEHQAEETKKPVEAFVEQAKAIIEKIAPTVYTTLITFLISKKLLPAEEALKAAENTEEAETMPTEVVESTSIEEQAEVAESDATEVQVSQENVPNVDE